MGVGVGVGVRSSSDVDVQVKSPSGPSIVTVASAMRSVPVAVRTLHRPIVTASAQYLVYQKTLSVDVTGEKSAALGNTQDFLAAFPGSVPPAFQQIASEISGRLSQALPGLFDAIPDQLSYRFRDEVFRPTVQAALPIYTGGAIPAVQRAVVGRRARRAIRVGVRASRAPARSW